MKIDIYNKTGKKTSKKVELNKLVFNIKPSEHSIYLAIKSELAAKRQGNAHSKTRAEVRGGGTKPWKQKGTGRARIGSLRNPSRVHGGAAFGPRKRSYSLKVNRKIKILARKSVLSMKVNEKKIMVLDSLNIETSKTKDLLKMLNLLNINNEKIIILCDDGNKSIYFSSRNLKNVKSKNVSSFSTCDVADSSFLLMDKVSVEYLNEKLS
tara:strand:+ start:562 stop:1188 length:627 start_codon:yes stop_codon:yes gene_type:complete